MKFLILNRWRSWLKPAIFLFLLGFTCFQFYTWRSFAVEVTWLQLKSLFLDLSIEDELKFGSICNSIAKHECSEQRFQRILRRAPGHQGALANLAIVYVKSQRAAQSMELFRHYFSRGGTAPDVMYWQGQAYGQLGQPAKALNWYYRAYVYAPDQLKMANELIDHLTDIGRFEEALSAMAAMTQGNPEEHNLWESKAQGLDGFLLKESEENKNKRRIFRLPGLGGRHHYLPVRLSKQSPYLYFLWDENAHYLRIPQIIFKMIALPEEEILESQWDSSDDDGKEEIIRLKEVRVGPWLIENVSAKICKDCDLRVGKALHDQIEIEEGFDESSGFLLVKKK